MENITIIQDTQGNDHAIIDHGDGTFTSMLKSTYDEMIAKRETKVI
jgi:hypothetical protein